MMNMASSYIQMAVFSIRMATVSTSGDMTSTAVTMTIVTFTTIQKLKGKRYDLNRLDITDNKRMSSCRNPVTKIQAKVDIRQPEPKPMTNLIKKNFTELLLVNISLSIYNR